MSTEPGREASASCSHGRDPEDCNFRGPCGDAAVLRPAIEAVVESNRKTPPARETCDCGGQQRRDADGFLVCTRCGLAS